MSLTIHSRAEEDTRLCGARLGRRLQGGELIGLTGDLGSGKTCFVRGLAQGLGIPARKVRSPSFTLVNVYTGGRVPLYHIDLYRLRLSDVDRMALREYLYGDGVCVVEWIERLGDEPLRVQIEFTFVGENERRLVVSARGERYDALLHSLQDGSVTEA